MGILLLTVCLLLSVNAQLYLQTVEEKQAQELLDEVVPASQASEHCKYAKTIRRPRNSKENPATSPNATTFNGTSKPKVVLVKKPIPKFTDTGSDEYYQAKITFPNKISSIEHEDEDFSVDDYDFDVNHDEYAGRGKPLEPRLVSKQRPKPPAEQLPPAPDPSKATVPRKEEKPLVKVAREVITYKAMDEYDDDVPAGVSSPERRINAVFKDDTASEESEDSSDSKEELKKSIRTTRSSPFSFGTYMDKLGEKTSHVSRMFSFLPLFPASHSSADNANEKVIAELTGRYE